MSSPAEQPLVPIFVGGAQRSGTHAVAALLGAHPWCGHVTHELLFHAVADGLPGVLDGSVTPTSFAERLRGPWWSRGVAWDATTTRGLHRLIDRHDLERALERYLADAEASPARAARTLVDDIVRAALSDPTVITWVEMTPTNAAAAPALLQMFPTLGLVHMMRDGRDVACSLAALPWGPTTPEKGLAHWGTLLRRHAAALAAAPADRIVTLHLEDLVLLDREASYERLLQFVGLPEDETVRAFFEEEMTPANARIGRWAAELHGAQRRGLTARYVELLAELKAAGVADLPDPDRIPAAVAYGPASGRSRVDPWADGRGA